VGENEESMGEGRRQAGKRDGCWYHVDLIGRVSSRKGGGHNA
jgi:hypothetical protein